MAKVQIKSEKLTPFGGIFDLSSVLLLKQRLLQEGKNDLLFSRLSVKETAYRSHFFEPNHLMLFFQTNDKTGYQ